MTKRLCGTLAVAALLGATVFGQAPPQPIDAIFKDFTTDNSPGCAVGVARGGAPLAAKAELPDYADAITIRQLLHHTSGLRDYLALSSLAGNWHHSGRLGRPTRNVRRLAAADCSTSVSSSTT